MLPAYARARATSDSALHGPRARSHLDDETELVSRAEGRIRRVDAHALPVRMTNLEGRGTMVQLQADRAAPIRAADLLAVDPDGCARDVRESAAHVELTTPAGLQEDRGEAPLDTELALFAIPPVTVETCNDIARCRR